MRTKHNGKFQCGNNQTADTLTKTQTGKKKFSLFLFLSCFACIILYVLISLLVGNNETLFLTVPNIPLLIPIVLTFIHRKKYKMWPQLIIMIPLLLLSIEACLFLAFHEKYPEFWGMEPIIPLSQK
jgi:hypothetical protein